MTATMREAYFNRFTIEMPQEAAEACSHQGACDEDVAWWAPRITRPAEATPKRLRAELNEYGAWEDDELADDDVNWLRIVWIAAGNIKEEKD